MDEVGAADPHAVSVSPRNQNVQRHIGEFDPGRHCQRPSVQTMHAVGLDEARQVGRATNPRYDHHVLGLDLVLDQSLFHRLENPEITAAGAPIGADPGLQGLDRNLLQCRDGGFRGSLFCD